MGIHLSIELSVVQSWAPTFDPGLVKTSKSLNSHTKMTCNAHNKKGLWPSLMPEKKWNSKIYSD